MTSFLETAWGRAMWNARDNLLDGLSITLQVTALGFIGAVVIGLALCLITMYIKPLYWPARFVVNFFRATPIICQLMWVNYVWPPLFGWPTSLFQAGCIALALQSAGYLAETFRAGIEGINRGHIEAGRSLGMPAHLVMRRIILPQAFHTMAPAIMNQFMVVIRSSTLVSIIGVADLMHWGHHLSAEWFEPIGIMSTIAVFYIVVIGTLSSLFKWYSERLRNRYV